MMKRAARSVFVLFLIGTLCSAVQASNVSVFDTSAPELSELVMTAPDFTPPEGPALQLAAPSDSVEVMEIEIPAEKEGNMFREVAMYTVLAAFAGIVVYVLFFQEEEEEEDGGGGKDIPTSVVPLF